MRYAWLFLAALVVMTLCTGPAEEPQEVGKPVVVNFEPSFLEAMAKGETTGKPIFAYFHSKTCGYCRLFEAETLTDAGVGEALEGFVSVEVDIDEDPQLAGNLKIFGTPTIVFFKAEKVEGTNRTSIDELDRRVGYITKEEFLDELGNVTFSGKIGEHGTTPQLL